MEFFEDFFQFEEMSIKPQEASYFIIGCNFTSTRKDKFVYDNFSVVAYEEDKTPPALVQIDVVDARKLELTFSEALDKNTAETISNYMVSEIGSPQFALLNTLTPNKVELSFGADFKSNGKHSLTISGLKDLPGNAMNVFMSEFEYFAHPKPGDLLISEILFDPYVNQQDFIEVYNVSNKTLLMDGLRIKNMQNLQEKSIVNKILLRPGQYLALTPDVASLKITYSPPTEANIETNDLPAFNNDEGHIILALSDGSILDSFTYADNWHLFFDGKTNVEGVSLEKANLIPFDNRRSNWVSSAKEVKYASPGYVNSLKLDKIAPEISSLEVVSPEVILLTFNDILNESSAEDTKNYVVDQGVGRPVFATLNTLKTNQVLLEFNNNFSPSSTYTITIEGIEDKNNNKITSTELSFGYGLSPEPGDLVISEILFNPNSGGQDFVELYNTRSEGVQIKGLSIKNRDNGQIKTIGEYYVIPAKSYCAISSNINSLIQIYSPPDTARLIENVLPVFNLDEGNVSIIDISGLILDSFDYHEDLHQQLIDKEDRKGVSLEKIRLLPFTNASSNWHSSAKAGNYATPGYRNSNYIGVQDIEDMFFIENKVISPNGDAKNDLLILQYQFPSPGFIANISVYSSEGYKVKNLTKNELLGEEGVITWDGSDDNGIRERLGIYIIEGTVFDVNGNVHRVKKDCVLADFID